MAFHGYVTPKGRQQIIEREQTSGAPIDADAQQRNIDFLAVAAELTKGWKLADAISEQTNAMIDGFNEVADMSPELERALNEMIERGEK